MSVWSSDFTVKTFAGLIATRRKDLLWKQKKRMQPYSDDVLLLRLLQLVQNLWQFLIGLHLSDDSLLFSLALGTRQHGTILDCRLWHRRWWATLRRHRMQESKRQIEPVTHSCDGADGGLWWNQRCWNPAAGRAGSRILCRRWPSAQERW